MLTDPEIPTQPPVRRRLRSVALVGIDGSGKTTQAHRLAVALAARGLPATYRRNAGGRRWFGRLAGVFGRRDAEDLLGRRGILLVESILRWLAIVRTLLRRAVTGEVAVMDRYAVCQFASLRSHSAARHIAERGPAERFARLAYRIFPAPDITFMLAVDPAVAYDRIEERGYDHESMDFLTAAAAAYRALPEYCDFVVIDANGTPDEVAAAIGAHLESWLPARPVSTHPEPTSGQPVHRRALRPRPRRREPARRRPAEPCLDEHGAAGQPAFATEHAKAILLAAGPLTAGASTVGHRVTEVVQTLV